MRILAIRGENLASLAGPFALDFERAPLRDAGFFAITGETGAGKSTILDALCLALYDRFPRIVASGAVEEVPDPSGKSIDSSDPRTILRRGAARGFAEVDFIARDGLRYRARCDLARARGRAGGALQKRARSLWRLDAAGAIVETLEAGIDAVNRRIVELTDLSFDQFRRTALLAQGDFDAFLRAEERERAELLEKITGADVYGLLSQRAFERARAAQQAVATLEQRGVEIGVMTPEARAEVEAQAAAQDAERAALNAQRAQIQDAIRRHDAQAQAEAKWRAACAAHEDALADAAALAPQCATLAEHRRAAPLRALSAEARRTQERRAQAERAAAEAQTQAQTAQRQYDDRQAHFAAAAEALADAQRVVADCAPLWARAADLDTRIEAAARDEADSAQLAQERAHAASQAIDAQAMVDARFAQCAREREAARAEAQRLAGAQPLCERWSEIDEQLAKRAEFSRARRQARTALAATQDDAQRAERQRAALDLKDREDAAALEALREKIQSRDDALLALDEPAARRRDELLAASLARLEAMTRIARDFGEAQMQAASEQVELARLAQEGAALAAQIDALQVTRARQAARNDDAARLGELADAAADPHALRLRAALDDDAPCPVCGGRDHPFARSADAAQTLVETLRREREAARRALAETDQAIVSAHAQAAQNSAQSADAARRKADAQARLAAARDAYDATRADDHDAPALAEAQETLPRLCAQIADARARLIQSFEAARTLRADLDRLRAASEDMRSAGDARRSERTSLETALTRALEERARRAADLDNYAERIDSLDRTLEPYLRLVDLAGDDLDRDADAARARLDAAGRCYDDARRRLATLDAECNALAIEAATRAAEARAAQESARQAAAAQDGKARALAALRESRAALLGGEATQAHRALREDALRLTQTGRDRARDALEQARAALAAADERANRCTRDATSAADDAQAAQTALAQAREAAGFDAPSLATALAVTDAAIADMRARVDAAENACAAAAAALGARRADLDEAQAAVTTQARREELVATERTLAQALDAASARVGALHQRLAADDAARARAQTLAGEIEAARAEQKLWDEINAAIGSASGDRFRRFAQAVTLDHLVTLANRRLASLTPRYALERAGAAGALGLQIVDRDLGDERRSTRSLSGGERFLASLALALALAGLEGRDSFVDTLFIDEGFGALDAATLDVAIDALETLQGQGRKVGVISHVEALQARIAVKVCVERRGGGVSVVRLRAPGIAGA